MAVAGWWADGQEATVAYLIEETASSARASVVGSASPMKNAVGWPSMEPSGEVFHFSADLF